MEAIYAAFIFAGLVGNLASYTNNPVAYQENIYTRVNSRIASLALKSNEAETLSIAEDIAEVSDLRKVLGNSAEVSPTDTPAPTATIIQKPTLISTPTPTSVPSPTNIPEPTPSVSFDNFDVVGAVERAANEFGVDMNLMKSIASCESGFNASAHNTAFDYGGLYQFQVGTWISTRTRMGADTNPALRFSAEEAARTAAFKIKHDGPSAWSGCL